MIEQLQSKQLIQLGWLVCLAFCAANAVVSISVSFHAWISSLYSSWFSMTWTAVTCTCYGVSGSLVCLSSTGATPTDIGFVLGCGFSLCFMLFMLFIYFVTYSNITNEVEDESALLTISIFYLFNSLAFGLFSCILFQFRSVIYKLDDLSVPYDVKVGENDNDNI